MKLDSRPEARAVALLPFKRYYWRAEPGYLIRHSLE